MKRSVKPKKIQGQISSPPIFLKISLAFFFILRYNNIYVGPVERYRSGHNGADSKSVCEQSHAGSNPALSVHKQTLTGVCFSFTQKYIPLKSTYSSSKMHPDEIIAPFDETEGK